MLKSDVTGRFWKILVVIDQLQDNKIVQTMHKYTYNNVVTPINTTKIKTAIKTTTKGNSNDPYSNGSGNNNNGY